MNASRNGFFHHFANSRKVRVDFFARMKHQFVFHRQTGNGEPRSFTGGKQFRSILIGVRHGLFGLRLQTKVLIINDEAASDRIVGIRIEQSAGIIPGRNLHAVFMFRQKFRMKDQPRSPEKRRFMAAAKINAFVFLHPLDD